MRWARGRRISFWGQILSERFVELRAANKHRKCFSRLRPAVDIRLKPNANKAVWKAN
jgi:hypothetical protein